MQLWHVVRGEQCPFFVFAHALHEQIGHPVGGIHVVRAPPVVTGVLAQIDKFLDVHVPGFKIGAHGPLAFTTLVNGHGGVVRHFEERYDTLGFTVGAFDVGAHAAHCGPVVTEAARELGK